MNSMYVFFLHFPFHTIHCQHKCALFCVCVCAETPNGTEALVFKCWNHFMESISCCSFITIESWRIHFSIVFLNAFFLHRIKKEKKRWFLLYYEKNWANVSDFDALIKKFHLCELIKRINIGWPMNLTLCYFHCIVNLFYAFFGPYFFFLPMTIEHLLLCSAMIMILE